MRNSDIPPIIPIIIGIVFAAMVFFFATDVSSMKERIILSVGVGTAFAAFFRLRGTRRKPSLISVIVSLVIIFLLISILNGLNN